MKQLIKEIEKIDFHKLVLGAMKSYEDAHGKIPAKGQISKRLHKQIRDVIIQKLTLSTSSKEGGKGK